MSPHDADAHLQRAGAALLAACAAADIGAVDRACDVVKMWVRIVARTRSGADRS